MLLNPQACRLLMLTFFTTGPIPQPRSVLLHNSTFSLRRRLYPPAWKPYGLEAEPEALFDIYPPSVLRIRFLLAICVPSFIHLNLYPPFIWRARTLESLPAVFVVGLNPFIVIQVGPGFWLFNIIKSASTSSGEPYCPPPLRLTEFYQSTP